MGNVKMQKVDLCVIQDNELAQVFLKTEKKPAVATVVVVDQTVPPNSPEVSGLHKALREKAEKENIPFYYGKGMCGKLLADGLLKPGQRAVTCDKAAGAARRHRRSGHLRRSDTVKAGIRDRRTAVRRT